MKVKNRRRNKKRIKTGNRNRKKMRESYSNTSSVEVAKFVERDRRREWRKKMLVNLGLPRWRGSFQMDCVLAWSRGEKPDHVMECLCNKVM